MSGINKQGNNGRIRKTQVESIPDFRRLSVHKGNRMITKNFTSYMAGTNNDLSDLIMFLIFESKRNNVVEVTTHLLVKYNKYIRFVKEEFSGVKFKGKSIMTIRGLLQRLIGSGILIHLSKKFFLINPALTYFEGYFNEQSMFMSRYEDLYSKYSIGQFGKAELNNRLTALAVEYYKQCINKNL